jgi:hypothetical protein
MKSRMKKDTTPLSITDKANSNVLKIIFPDIKGPFPIQSKHHNNMFIL